MIKALYIPIEKRKPKRIRIRPKKPKVSKWCLFEDEEHRIYYNIFPYKRTDTLLLKNIDPDIIWELNFNKERILKYYEDANVNYQHKASE